MYVKKYFIIIINILLHSFLFAQDQNEIINQKLENDWKISVEPNMMIPTIKGNVGAGKINNIPYYGSIYPELNIKQSSKEFFDRFKYGGMLTAEITNGNISVNGDFSYFLLETKGKYHPILNEGKVNAKQFFGDVTVYKKFNKWIDVGVGLDFIYVDAKIHAKLINPISNPISIININQSKSRFWVDPMLSIRTTNLYDSKFLYMARADVGSFGLGSKLAWQTIGHVGYKFSNTFYGILGYRYLSIDYKRGSDENRFIYNLDIFGPFIKLGIDL